MFRFVAATARAEHPEDQPDRQEDLVPPSLMREQHPHPERINSPLAVNSTITASSAYWVRTASLRSNRAIAR